MIISPCNLSHENFTPPLTWEDKIVVTWSDDVHNDR